MRNPDYSLYLIVLNLIACTKYLLPCYVIYSLILKLGHEHLEANAYVIRGCVFVWIYIC